ncbi:metal-dependent phosphohydrolase [Mumia sp. Pv 4-285]|uniref:HD domain-containing protein n=1 Tax=Mumia qirimensis TaxID=3234852 RepID=UPI00351D516D
MHPRIRLELAKRWSEPHREHHDTDHLAEVVRAVDLLASSGMAFDIDTVNTAAWFHDAVYDVHRADNVERSATLAQRWLGPGEGDRIAQVVMATTDHVAATGDVESAVLCDADLSILGADTERYDRYAHAIRVENLHVPDAEYRRLRSRVLARYQARSELFATAAARELWEDQARENLARELTRLGRPVAV